MQTPPKRLSNFLILAAKVLLVCTLLGLFFATRLYLIRDRIDHQPISWWAAIRFNVMTWYLWAVAACLVILLARRYPMDFRNWRRRGLLHAAGSVTVALIHIAMFTSWYWAFEVGTRDPRSWWSMYKLHLMISFHWDVLIYAGILAINQALTSARYAREREVRTTQLEAQLSKAQLGALRMQLNPHFLFNSLNTVTAFISENPQAAEDVVVRLSRLLRTALEQSDTAEVPLSEELDFARQFLEIERLRFGDRLILVWDIQAEAEPALVPSLMLQPLIENAVRYGIGRHGGDCEIRISSVRIGDLLQINVHNHSIPTEQGVDGNGGLGVGLQNTRSRLGQLYGCQASLEIIHSSPHEWTTRISIPFRTRPTQPSAERARA